MKSTSVQAGPKKQRVILIVCILVLAAAVGIFAWLNRPDTSIAPGTLRISQGDRIVKTFTLDELKALPSVQVQKTIVSSKEEDESGLYTGVPLKQVLDAADPSLLETGTQIVARAEDGFTTSYSADEVKAGDNILLVYAKDGEPLKDQASGGAGPMRILVQEDPFGNRCIKYLNDLEVG